MADNTQVTRWCFTMHNYDVAVDYKERFSSGRFDVRRAVLGFESNQNRRHRHIQGYVEFSRSRRFTYVIGLLPSAHWQRAVGSALQNYVYCTKSKVFELIGDWRIEQSDLDGNVCGLLIMGLLSEHRANVKCSKEYMLHSRDYDAAAKLVSNIRQHREAFQSFQNMKLSDWQLNIFELLFKQSKREILWVCDEEGNRGKTFLCQYLRVLYNFFISDGTLDSRDITYMLPETFGGIIFDVKRSMQRGFNYDVLESAKDGYMVSGKYEGTIRNFKPVPVAAFGNFLPDLDRLSVDRWRVVHLGKGQYAQADSTPLHSTIHISPYVKPPELPELNDHRDIIRFLRVKFNQNGSGVLRTQPTGKFYNWHLCTIMSLAFVDCSYIFNNTIKSHFEVLIKKTNASLRCFIY